LLRTGRSAGQLEHWLKLVPVQEAQSEWHAMHAPEDEKVLEGHELTHLPPDANWPPAQVRQNVEDPKHDPHDESQASHVTLSLGDRNVLEGQLSMQVPLERTKPGRQPVHWSWSTVDATLKLGMPQAVHLDGQP
jgi:hypothetical protein